MNKLVLIIPLVILFATCKPDLDYKISGYTQKIIVEGFIYDNDYPSVYLSLNIPLSEGVDTATILKNVIRTAKVTVSDGENTEVLTSRWDKTHFPPYVYRGYDIKGEEGKTYYLKVEYSGHTLHAKTTIPKGTGIRKFEMSPVTDKQLLRALSFTFDINPTQKTAYRIFTRKTSEKNFRETPVVFNSEFTLSGPQTFNISPRTAHNDTIYKNGYYFAVGDTVLVKLCTIDSVSTQFFKSLTMFSSNGIGSGIFIGEKDMLKSNVSEPGFGIWHGNAVRQYMIFVK